MSSIWLGEVIFLPGAIYLPPIALKYWKGDVSRLTKNSPGVSPSNQRVGAAIVATAIAGISASLMIPLIVLATWVKPKAIAIICAILALLLLSLFVIFAILGFVVYFTNKPSWIIPPPFRD